jgi:hypothetical protein
MDIKGYLHCIPLGENDDQGKAKVRKNPVAVYILSISQVSRMVLTNGAPLE